jgi:hypothetical protein
LAQGVKVTEPQDPKNPAPDPVKVTSLADYRPTGRSYEVSITFSGDAAVSMSKLMVQLKVDNPNDVVKRAIALLLTAEGKQILLVDPKTGTAETVEI